MKKPAFNVVLFYLIDLITFYCFLLWFDLWSDCLVA